MSTLAYLPHELDAHPDAARIRATIAEEVAKVEPEEDWLEDDYESAWEELARRAKALISKLETKEDHADELAAVAAAIDAA